MADWSAIRRLARARRDELLLGRIANSSLLVPAEELIETALRQTGLTAVPVPPDDPLLAGAHAVLDRETSFIWHSADASPETTRFNIAHELAHWWLHETSASCDEDDLTPDPITDPLPFGQDYVAGYSPAQRREVEANVFAVELLLPAPIVRDAFLQGATAQEMAAAAGLSEAAVLGQMAESLLGAPFEPPPTSSLPESPMPPLDASQKAAAEVAHGPVLITAGPGTGKTRALIGRVLYLLESGISPDSILALTFSNKAAQEMRERLEQVAPDAARRLWIGTFHAFGLEMLRRYGVHLGLPPVPALLDPLDAVALLEQNLTRLNLREYEYLHNPAYPFRDILSAISRAKDELVTPEQYAEMAARMASWAQEGSRPPARLRGGRDEKEQRAAAKIAEVAEVYRVWQEILRERGMLDFGDLIARTVELFTACPQVCEAVRRQYPHVLVDEYQDINRASAVMVRLIAGEGRGLWAVGDLRQAIYRFRGASPANLTHFEQDYPTGRRLSLAVNYRSAPPLVQLFSVAARRMAAGDEADAWLSTRPAEETPITVAEAENEEAQADGIAMTVQEFVGKGRPLHQQAILCRTHSQAEQLGQALEARGIPVLYLGDLFTRPEVKDMLALVSLAAGSGGALARVGRFLEYGLDMEQIYTLLVSMRERRVSLAEALQDECTPEGAKRLLAHLGPIVHRSDAYTLLTRYLFGPAEYLRRLLRRDDVQAAQSRIALHQLLLLARAHTARLRSEAEAGASETVPKEATECCPYRAFLAHVRRLIGTREDTRLRMPAESEEIPAVKLLTIHSAKGLEFPVVYLPNLCRDGFPPRGRNSLVPSPPELQTDFIEGEEQSEECLFFVAISRARDYLILSYPRRVGGKSRAPSPLFRLIEEALDECGARRLEWRSQAIDAVVEKEASSTLWTPPPGSVAEHSIHAVEQYMRCPRQYYYDQVLSLPGDRDASAYGAFHECLWATLRWVDSERAAGRKAALEEALQHLGQQWEAQGPVGHPHEPLLRKRAEEIVTQLSRHRAERAGKADRPVIVRLPGGSIRLRLDFTQETSDGRLVVEWYRTGRPSDEDHKKKRLALIRQGVLQSEDGRPVDLQILYLATGERRPVPEQPRYEPKRVEKYDNALHGIQRGEFPANPSDENCPACPFFFICPA